MAQDAITDLCEVSSKLTGSLTGEQLAAAARCLDNLRHPLGRDDIETLMKLLPDDGDPAQGLNWTILHAIEASPYWPLWNLLQDEQSEWVSTLRIRLSNAGLFPPSVGL